MSRTVLIGPSGPLALRPKAFDVLVYLANHPNRLITKSELLDAVWPNVHVTENSLVQCVSEIRAALGEHANVLKTVAKRGYIFSGVLSEAAHPGSDEMDLDTAKEKFPPTAAASTGRSAPKLVLIALLVLLVAGLAAAATLWQALDGNSSQALMRADDLPRPKGRVSIAVLPLAALDSTSEDYFADGLTEDIINALARFSDVSVLSLRTVASYKGRSPAAGEIARELKVNYLAEGSVRRNADRLRITMRLADATSGQVIWTDQFDTHADQVFAVQDEITRKITGSLAVRITSSEQARISSRPVTSLETYELVLRGREMLTRLTRTATSNARTMFERALELDPNYAPAYVGLGRVDLISVHLGWTADPAGTLRRAESHARKAIGIDEFNPLALALLGRIHTRLGEYDRAVELLRRAVALNPSEPESNASFGDALLWNGDIGEALKALEVAAQLDPRLSSEHLFNLGAAYFLLGEHTRAAQILERSVSRQDGNAFIYALLAATYADAGRKEDASHAINELRRLNPVFDFERFGTLFRNPDHREKIAAALRSASP